jgi:CRISPR-associated endonuclease Csn1
MKNKKILGLDLGTTSIGWALVNEKSQGKSEIIKLGVRVNPLTSDEQTDFEKGRPQSINADRTLKRGARRNLQRFKLRRKNLIEILMEQGIIDKKTPLTEIGKCTTHQTLEQRAKAAKQKISLVEFAKVLLAINKKRGYKSSRKAKNEEEGSLIDGMGVAKEMYERAMTPGQFAYELLSNNKKYIPDFYRSDLQNEFDTIWKFQQQFYPDILREELYQKLQGKGKQKSSALFLAIHQIYTAENKGKRELVKMQHYKWRSEAINSKLSIQEVAYVLVEINNDLNKSSGYLGAISDRSKILFFNNETVGENLFKQILKNPHTSLKNQVFYRQDYLDEFEKIWEEQAKHHSILTKELKQEIRDIVIFYQRKLKSQKHLIANCLFEQKHKTVPKSSLLFQEFKIWQNINNLIFINTETKEKQTLELEDKKTLFEELNIKGNLKEKELLKFLGLNNKLWKTNFPEGVEGNRTNASLYNAYHKILEDNGYGFDWDKKTGQEQKEEIKQIFKQIGINTRILDFDAGIKGNDFDKQTSYQLWHLLYAAEDDNKISKEDKEVYGDSNVSLKKILHYKYGITPKYAKLISNVLLQNDYGSLSAKAIKKLLPHLKNGLDYASSCDAVGYNHSNALTAEEQANRVLKEKLKLLPKNSLRNPVVEKILNQMVNLINQVVDVYGKPDEIRIELARELKKSAKQRQEMTKHINTATKANLLIKAIITKEFGIPNPTKNDVVRYKLWQELKDNNYKTLFTNQYVPKEKIFSKDIDIEHIIPKALLFDDSFSNKTLAYRTVNLKKSNRTALDFITEDYSSELENFMFRIENLYKKGAISKGKYQKLLTTKEKLPEGFISRDLKNSQYIAKQAKAMLEEVFRTVISTTGSITDKLRSDWDLINVMKELNLAKYKALGLTTIEIRKNNKKIEVIKDWTKRNDHRHHAMDALTVAFTTHNHIQYINNLSARFDERNSKHKIIKNIEALITVRKEGKKVFSPPMPNFRTVAKEHLEAILISYKTKNKVVTRNKNKFKVKDGHKVITQLTPRGKLHKETIYAKSYKEMTKPTKLNTKFGLTKAKLIINKDIKAIVLAHLAKYENEPKLAFQAKILKKEPLIYKKKELKEVFCFEEIYTIRKEISPDLKIEKVVDEGIKTILKKRLLVFNNKPKEAFSDLDKNPIWLNKKAGISIKRVTITGISTVIALHSKKDHLGKEILDNSNKQQATDYVSTGNNHHIAIYEDEKGNLQERTVSFFEAVTRANEELSIIDKNYNNDKGWKFLFTMKQNELFIFKNDDFDPNKIDLLDKGNATKISPHLFRVQKIGSKDYWFRHHLESTVINNLDFTYKRISSTKALRNIIKVRTNHLGEIVQVGEY